MLIFESYTDLRISNMSFTTLIHKELSYVINGILYKTHISLGRFHNEKQYCDAIKYYLKHEKIYYEREKILPISFEGENPGRNKVDFLVENKIVLEVKCKRFISREDYYQIKRYSTSLNLKLGILVNFRKKYIEPKRIINSQGHEIRSS